MYFSTRVLAEGFVLDSAAVTSCVLIASRSKFRSSPAQNKRSVGLHVQLLSVTCEMHHSDQSSVSERASLATCRNNNNNNNNVRLLQLQSERYNRTNICHTGQH